MRRSVPDAFCPRPRRLHEGLHAGAGDLPGPVAGGDSANRLPLCPWSSTYDPALTIYVFDQTDFHILGRNLDGNQWTAIAGIAAVNEDDFMPPFQRLQLLRNVVGNLIHDGKRSEAP